MSDRTEALKAFINDQICNQNRFLDYTKETERFAKEFPELKDKVYFVIKNKDDGPQAVFDHVLEKMMKVYNLDTNDPSIAKMVKSLVSNNIQTKMGYKLAFAIPLSYHSNLSNKFGEPIPEHTAIVLPAENYQTIDSFVKNRGPISSIQNFDEEMVEWLYAMPQEASVSAMKQKFIFDHEIAHVASVDETKMSAIDPKTKDFRNLWEHCADAYALIRYYQATEKNGLEDLFPEHIKTERLFGAVYHGDTTHMTMDSIDAVIEKNKNGKLDGLTPQQSIALAMDIAIENAHSPEQLYAFKDCFEEEHKTAAFLKRPLSEVDQTFRDVAQKAMDTKSAFTQKTLLAFLDRAHNFYVQKGEIKDLNTQLTDIIKSKPAPQGEPKIPLFKRAGIEMTKKKNAAKIGLVTKMSTMIKPPNKPKL